MENGYRKAALAWMLTALAVFSVMVVLGITMRLAQGARIQLAPQTFYALMTMHGLGMAGSLFSAGLAMIWHIASRTCRPNVGVMWVAWAIFVVGAVGLLSATLIGGFGPGWYALYPLPFVNPVWPSWSTGVAIGSLMVMGVAWLLLQLDLLRAMASRYGASRILAWQYLGAKEPAEPLPAQILIASVCATAGTLGTLSGAVTLVLYLLKWLAPGVQLDPLLLKNSMFMFGHTIVNVCIYCGLCAIYFLLPRYTGRPWRVNRVTAIAWNATLVFVLFAYFHHLYMDFAQVQVLHVFGQIASYGSALPATAVSIFGVASQVYRSGLRWRFTQAAFLAGVVGWAVGGVAAVIDSTIAVNSVFHNTLWVPGHFHTYFLVGFVLMFLGYLHDFLESRAEGLAIGSLIAMLSGGYGFVLMFYLGGVAGVPRRFASYAQIPFGQIAGKGAMFASFGALFASLFLLGAAGFALALVRGRGRAPGGSPALQPVKR